MKQQINDDILNSFNYYSQIENTRMIFDFIEELHKRCEDEKVYNGEGGLKERDRKVKHLADEISELIENVPEDSSSFSLQNPLTPYIIFWNRMYSTLEDLKIENPPKKNTNTKAKTILANMLNLFRIVNELEDNKSRDDSHDDLPYMYEDICLSICKIIECDMCSIFYDDSTSHIKTVMHSGYLYRETAGQTETIKSNIINPIIKKEDNKIIEGIYIDEGHSYTSIIIEMPVHKNKHKLFMVVKKLSDNISRSEWIKKLTMFLFLKDRILMVLARDYATLLNLRFDESYIKPQDINSSQPHVLHLSDLHITENRRWEIDSLFIKKLVESLEASEKRIDLIAITGDIVHASKDSQSAQKRYERAGKIIEKFAFKLWGEYDKEMDCYRLSHDWKRRILITTGNHDYAAMNDLIVETRSRVTQSGAPSKGGGETMSKFTYYIEFLQKYLDAPIDRLVKNDLNEIRTYRRLGLNVLILNSSSFVNTLQNNKVGFDCNKTEKLLRNFSYSEDSKHNWMCLTHHAPNYDINYVEDGYEVHRLFLVSEIKETSLGLLYETFYQVIEKSSLQNVDDSLTASFKKNFEKFEECIKKYQKENHSDSKDEIKKYARVEGEESEEIDVWIKRFYESALFQDISQLYDYLCRKDDNEFSMQLRNKFYSLIQLQKKDKDSFSRNFKNICEQITAMSSTVPSILAGHVHEHSISEWEDLPVYTQGAKIQDGEINMGESIITIERNK